MDAMATHDTDPQTSPPVAPDDGTTAPGPPPEVTDEDVDAAALIAGLGGAPLPERGVRETSGHMAAAVAVAAHAPRRAHGLDREEAAVVLNTTEPLPRAIPMVEPLGPSAEGSTPSNLEADPVIARPHARIYTTAPSARVAARRRSVVVATLAVAATAGIVVTLIVRSRIDSEPAGTAPATASSSAHVGGSSPATTPSAAPSASPSSTAVVAPAPVERAATAAATSLAAGATAPRTNPAATVAATARTPAASGNAAAPPVRSSAPAPAAHPAPSPAGASSSAPSDFPWRQ